MTRAELINAVAEQNVQLVTKEMAEQCVIAVLDTIGEGLAEGKRVELRGFGIFMIRNRKARVGRNPRTGDAVQVEPKKVPFFRASSMLKARLNEARG